MAFNEMCIRDRLLFLLGALGLYGFMFLYLTGLSKTTPVSSSIFTSLQPIWVFLIMVFFYKEKATRKKIIGISIGLTGALAVSYTHLRYILCVYSLKHPIRQIPVFEVVSVYLTELILR